MKEQFEFLIIGGGPAGLTAALTIGRINRSALLCDDNRPRNLASEHLNNFPTQDGINPKEWRKAVNAELEKYASVKTATHSITKITKHDNCFHAETKSGESFIAKKVILAFGIKDRMLDIEGFSELWGKSIFHCVFCHGFEVKGERVGFFINNENSFHQLPLVRSLASELVVFTNGSSFLTSEQLDFLEKNFITIHSEKIKKLHMKEERLESVVFENGQSVKLHNLFSPPSSPFELKSDIGDQLGCAKDQFGLITVNEMGETSVDGVFAAGDMASMRQSVLLACAAGVKAATGAIFSLMHE